MKKSLLKLCGNNLIILILFAIIGFALYFNVLKGPFLWDDRGMILENKYITSFEYFPNWFQGENVEAYKEIGKKLYRPVSTFFYASIYSVAELNVTAYHIALLLVHIFNAFLVFTLLGGLRFSRIGSLLAALIFLIHPVQTTSVSYMAGAPDVLSAMFVLLGLNFLIRKDTSSTVASGACLILGLLSKELAIVFVPLAILIVIYNRHIHGKFGKFSKRDKVTIAAFIGASIAYMLFRHFFLNSEGLGLKSLQASSPYTEHLYIRIITFVSILWEYAKMIFAPINLYFDRLGDFYETPLNLRFLFGSLVIVAGLIGSYFSFKKSGKFFLGFFWFFIALAPVSGIIVGNNTHRENWIYLPIVGILILLAALWDNTKTKEAKIFFLVAFTITGILLATKTVERNFQWANPTAFFKNELKHNPLTPRIYSQYGKHLYREGLVDEAINAFGTGISVAKPKEDILTMLHYDLGVSYIVQKNLNMAISQFLMVFETNPNHDKAHEQLGKLFRLGGYDERAAKFEEFALRIQNGGTVTFEEILATKELK